MTQTHQILNILKGILERQTKLVLPKIEFRKFKPGTNADITNKDFYNLPGIYYLLNGTNKNISSAGSGTTGAISKISDKLFNHKRFELVYDSNTLVGLDQQIKQIISSSEQRISSTDVISNGKYAGSVFFIDSSQANIKQYNNLIGGVYHINGIDWKNVQNKQQNIKDLSIPLIYKYYDQVLKHFINFSKNNPLVQHNIHLAKIPGDLFYGGDETYKGMIQAILNNESEINKNNVHLIVDMEKSFYDSNKPGTKPVNIIPTSPKPMEYGLILVPSVKNIPPILISEFSSSIPQNLMTVIDNVQYTGNEWHLRKRSEERV